MNCDHARALIGAYADGQTDRLQRHSMKLHLRSCPACVAQLDELRELHGQIRAEVPRFAAPPALRERVQAMLDVTRPPATARRALGAERPRWLAAGALAGCVATMLAWLAGTSILQWRANDDLAAEAVTSHVRATLGNHMTQVASSDQHTVKPWLSARLDYSPPVRDLAPAGFPLEGGRIDYLDRHPVATLVYRYREHSIDVFVRPQLPRAPAPALRTLRGFNVAHASGAGMDWIAVSDVNPDVLAAFVARLALEAAAP